MEFAQNHLPQANLNTPLLVLSEFEPLLDSRHQRHLRKQ